MSHTIVVRGATASDGAARAALVRDSVMHFMRDAFFMFLFQELTLQLCVLGGAVLFIFCGASVAVCCALVPAAAALVVAASVYVTHAVLADKHVVDMRNETFGLVAELHGAWPRVPPVVGTVSVSELRGAARGGWLHALAVHERCRRRGAARALVRSARTRSDRGPLLAATSSLQTEATRLLHDDGWEVRGSYHRPLLGSALTLPVLVLGVESSTLA